MKTVTVKFANSGTAYDYLYDLPDPVAVGDNLVVDSPYSGLACVVVLGVKETGGTKYVVDKVNTAVYKAREAQRAKVKALKTELDKKLKKMESTFKYEMLVKYDADAAEMLEQLQRLEEK